VCFPHEIPNATLPQAKITAKMTSKPIGADDADIDKLRYPTCSAKQFTAITGCEYEVCMVDVYIHIYTYTYTCIHINTTYMCICMYIHMFIYVCIYV